MIRFTFILSALFLALNVSHAQSHKDLKGPAAKNYKPWEQQARKSTLFIKLDGQDRKGPDFKNQKPWKEDQPKEMVNTDLRTRERVTGPKAKNQKPWDNN